MSRTPAPWRAHLLPTAKLAVPVMFARAGILLLAIVDTVMCGWSGADELAWYGLGTSAHMPLLLVGVGFLVGTTVLTAQHDGAGRTASCGAVLHASLLHAFVYGMAVLAICQLGESLLVALGQPPGLAAGAGRVLVQFGWGLPAVLLYSATVFFLEGLHKPLPGMIVMALANIVNVALNWVFMFGHLGAPAMGAEGAAVATSIVRWLSFVAVFGYAWTRLDRARYGLTGAGRALGGLGRELRRIGTPMAIGQGLESSAFAAMAMFAGWIGAVAIAAWTIAGNLLAMVFMFSLGLTAAAGIRVANATARDDWPNASRAGWVAAGLTVLTIGTIAGLLFSGRALVVALYADTGAIVVVTTATLAVTALMLVPDGLQSVLAGSLRGASDFWAATLIQSLAFWGLMVPLAYYLGVIRGAGAPGLMFAVVGGVALAAVLLGGRFAWLIRARSAAFVIGRQ